MTNLNADNKKTQKVDFEERDRLYQLYVDAVECYVKEPTADNWEQKEKAFETYNALIEAQRKAC